MLDELLDSPMVHDMALSMQEMSAPIRIGNILDAMESAWNAAEKSKALERKAGGAKQPYQMVVFPRATATAALIERYPWTNPRHPDNPDRRFFRANMRGIADARAAAVASGNPSTLAYAQGPKEFR